jgi:uncharacterized protein YjeT (DUF2065 family)
MTNIRLVGYTALAVGLINWRYIDFNAGSFALIVGVLILISTFITPLHAALQKRAGFALASIVAGVAIVYSFLA